MNTFDKTTTKVEIQFTQYQEVRCQLGDYFRAG